MLYPQSRAHGQVAVQMWNQVHELCRIEANKIEAALAKLQEAWPTTQEAAAAFQTWAARWVTAMRATAENARINGPIIDAITHEIDAARDKVAALVDEALEYERMGETQAEIAYYAKHAVHGDWAVTGWREGLNRQARDIMANMELQVATYASGFAMEQPFMPDVRDGFEPVEPYQVPELPMAWPGVGGSSLPQFADAAGFSPDDVDSSVQASDESTVDGSSGVVNDAGSGDTILDGANTIAIDPMIGQPIGAWPGGVGPGGSFVDTPAGRVLAPGGVLGPALGNRATGGLAGAPAAVRAGMMPMVPPIMGGQPPATPGNTRSAGKRRSRKRSVPSIFEVGQGGPDVILPAEEPDEFDPGPNVFGIDR